MRGYVELHCLSFCLLLSQYDKFPRGSLHEKKINEIQNGKPTDYKTLLQQFAEQDGTAVLRYETVQSGELHDPTFTTTAYINNNAVGTGTSGTKKGSEMAAARVALSLFGIIE